MNVLDESTARTSRVAVLVVGDEILRGQVRDSNAHYMAQRLFDGGAELRCVQVVGDEVEAIAEAVSILSVAHDYLIVCGGIGPTHDDVTMEAVARAFGVDLSPKKELVELLEGWRGVPLDAAVRRMTLVPEGAGLLPVEGFMPVVQMKNTVVLPGVPRILRVSFDAISGIFQTGEPPRRTRCFVTKEREHRIAENLRCFALEVGPNVSVGSYPRRTPTDAAVVRITLTSRDIEALEVAHARLLERIPDLKPE